MFTSVFDLFFGEISHVFFPVASKTRFDESPNHRWLVISHSRWNPMTSQQIPFWNHHGKIYQNLYEISSKSHWSTMKPSWNLKKSFLNPIKSFVHDQRLGSSCLVGTVSTAALRTLPSRWIQLQATLRAALRSAAQRMNVMENGIWIDLVIIEIVTWMKMI